MLADFVLSRMNDFQRLSNREPNNYTAFECVRFCADILYRLGLSIVRKDGRNWEIIKKSC